jgi:hypothetical protein
MLALLPYLVQAAEAIGQGMIGDALAVPVPPKAQRSCWLLHYTGFTVPQRLRLVREPASSSDSEECHVCTFSLTLRLMHCWTKVLRAQMHLTSSVDIVKELFRSVRFLKSTQGTIERSHARGQPPRGCLSHALHSVLTPMLHTSKVFLYSQQRRRRFEPQASQPAGPASAHQGIRVRTGTF